MPRFRGWVDASDLLADVDVASDDEFCIPSVALGRTDAVLSDELALASKAENADTVTFLVPDFLFPVKLKP